MADYAGLAIAAGQVILSLVAVVRDAKDAPKDIQDLRCELLDGLRTIKGYLGFLGDLSDQSRHKLEATDWRRRAYEEIKSMTEKDVLRHSSTLGRANKKIERIKLWFMVSTTNDFMTRMEQLCQEMQSLQASIGEDKDKRTREEEQSSQRTILQYLAPLSPEGIHRKNLSLHKPKTSTWFIEGPLREFLHTTIGDRYVLWLKGKSGSGKTTLLAKSVDFLRHNHKEIEVLCWYCAFDDLDSQQPENFLGWIITNLSARIPGLLLHLTDQMEYAEQKGDKPVFNSSELEETLLDHSTAVPPMIIFIDAINESAKREDLEFLVNRLTAKLPNIRIVVSSTRNPVSQGAVFRKVKMSEDRLKRDIDLTITNILESNDVFRSLSLELRERIHNTVLSKSKGMFRYAHYVMNELKDKGNGRLMLQALESLPSDLNVMYATILENVRCDRDIFKEALRWLCFSKKPLKLDELAELIVIEDGDIDIDEDTRLSSPLRMLVEESHGLVVYDTETRIVSLSHSTVKEFLTSNFLQEAQHVSRFAIGAESLSHHHMLKTFMTYLSFSIFKRGYGSIDRNTLERYHAIGYISRYWPDYLQVGSPDDWILISNFFKSRVCESGGNYGAWIYMLALNLPSEVVQSTHPIYYAAGFNYIGLVETILRCEQDINLEAPGGRHGSTVLQMSCWRLRKKIVQMLVEAGADPTSKDRACPRRCSLWWAQQNGWDDVVQLMTLKAGRFDTDDVDTLPVLDSDSREEDLKTRTEFCVSGYGLPSRMYKTTCRRTSNQANSPYVGYPINAGATTTTKDIL
ncbi:hypothetical protein G7054_g9850 [Neopestalotiopsis clavispora]|nr:hypothetical protein G7054_g9850 [Neopestalotiopsis clavispora]